MLTLVLALHPAQLSVAELAREMSETPEDRGERGDVEQALRDLIGTGLLRRSGESVLPSRAGASLRGAGRRLSRAGDAGEELGESQGERNLASAASQNDESKSALRFPDHRSGIPAQLRWTHQHRVDEAPRAPQGLLQATLPQSRRIAGDASVTGRPI